MGVFEKSLRCSWRRLGKHCKGLKAYGKSQILLQEAAGGMGFHDTPESSPTPNPESEQCIPRALVPKQPQYGEAQQ